MSTLPDVRIEAPPRDASAIDFVAFVAFVAAILSVFLTALSRVWGIPLALLLLVTLPWRSTRTVGRWAVLGVGIGVVALAALVALLAMSGPLIPEG